MTEFSIGERPFPEPDERSRPFFEATLREELLLQHCGTCGRWTWPVKERCIECFADNLQWKAASGAATLYSFTLVHQLVHPGFKGEMPYNLSQVDLDEGVRIHSSVVGCRTRTCASACGSASRSFPPPSRSRCRCSSPSPPLPPDGAAQRQKAAARTCLTPSASTGAMFPRDPPSFSTWSTTGPSRSARTMPVSLKLPGRPSSAVSASSGDQRLGRVEPEGRRRPPVLLGGGGQVVAHHVGKDDGGRLTVGDAEPATQLVAQGGDQARRPTAASWGNTMATANWQRPRATWSSAAAVAGPRLSTSSCSAPSASASVCGFARRAHRTSIVSATTFMPVPAHSRGRAAARRARLSNTTQRGSS